jgi:pyrimidine-nucleoside phosphorylase
MIPQWIIEKKRDGLTLDDDEIRFMVDGFTRGSIPDYQMAALAMAICIRGMSPAETSVLTDAMMRSGERLDPSSFPGPTVDKHSTGGIGDKVMIILAPLVACCGVTVPSIAGRGLGITGGTLDKLESIPGYRTGLTTREFIAVVSACGCSIAGQTPSLVPADRKLYALRDVTGTVPSIPLICASIMSKKLAEGTAALVLDVKCGRGAFMKTRDQARALATALCEVGHRMRCPTTALITAMDQPLGRAVGNAVEVAECVEILEGRGPADLLEVTLALGAQMLVLGGIEPTGERALERLRPALASGQAFEKLKTMVRLQGGDPRALDEPARLPKASLSASLPAPRAGFIADVDAEKVGRACVALGAGRVRTDDTIDPAAGIIGLLKPGERVETDQPLCTLLAGSSTRLQEARRWMDNAFTVAEVPRPVGPLVLETLSAALPPSPATPGTRNPP